MELTVSKIAHKVFGDVLFATPTEQCEMRVQTFFHKEPDTIEWLAELDPGDVLYDVGANVGMYSIWAAKTTGARVFAFEPESQNFAILCQNIMLNRLGPMVMAYPLAISDEARIAPLYVSRFEPGCSCHTFGEAVTWKRKEMREDFAQGSVSVRLDAMLGVLPPPDLIKIDVDGLEPNVLRGAMECVEAARSVLVEIDTNREDHNDLFSIMEGMGFRWDGVQAEASRRKEGPFKGIGNVIFRRF